MSTINNTQAVSGPKNQPIEITLASSSLSNNYVGYSITADPKHGALSTLQGNVLTFTPQENYAGIDSFKFSASEPGMVTIDLKDRKPIANSQAISCFKNASKNILLTSSDPDNDAVTYSISADPLHGSLSGKAPELLYTPEKGYSGDDSFEFIVNDGRNDSEPAIVEVSVENRIPTAHGQTVDCFKNSSTVIRLTAEDPDKDIVSYKVASLPSHGTLSGKLGTDPGLTYTPLKGYSGKDSFTFIADDGEAVSEPATIFINVKNRAPVGIEQNITGIKSTQIPITLNANDQDQDTVSYRISSVPSHGTLSGKAPDVVYTPEHNYIGEDSFQFIVNDGEVDSIPANISITLKNRPPIAYPQTLITGKNIALPIVLTGDDPDNDELVFVISRQPSHGTLSGEGSKVIYTPEQDYAGTDSFEFIVDDQQSQSEPALVAIDVQNNAPKANDKIIDVIGHNVPVELLLTASDPNMDKLAYKVTVEPSHGTLSGSTPNLVYTPDKDYSGTDSFKFIVNNGELDSDPGTVVIYMSNRPPIALGQTQDCLKNISIDIVLNSNDPDNDELSYSIKEQPSHGVLIGSGRKLVYEPDNGYAGQDSFKFAVNDGKLNSNAATVLINVKNQAPEVTDLLLESSPFGIEIMLSSNAKDANKDALVCKIKGDMEGDYYKTKEGGKAWLDRAELSGSDYNIFYQPKPGFAGEDSFEFIANDGDLDSNIGTVKVNVINIPPEALNKSTDFIHGNQEFVILTLEGGDQDSYLEDFTYKIKKQPEYGSLTKNDGTSAPDGLLDIAGDYDHVAATLRYYPKKQTDGSNYVGDDTFTYILNDGIDDSEPGTVTITLKSSSYQTSRTTSRSRRR